MDCSRESRQQAISTADRIINHVPSFSLAGYHCIPPYQQWASLRRQFISIKSFQHDLIVSTCGAVVLMWAIQVSSGSDCSLISHLKWQINYCVTSISFLSWLKKLLHCLNQFSWDGSHWLVLDEQTDLIVSHQELLLIPTCMLYDCLYIHYFHHNNSSPPNRTVQSLPHHNISTMHMTAATHHILRADAGAGRYGATRVHCHSCVQCVHNQTFTLLLPSC